MSVTQAPSRNDSGTAASAAAIPLAGRRLEIDRFLREVDAEATERPAALKVLQGEPGIGKTRLLEEMGRILEDKGWLCLRGRAFEAERSRAFGPWIDAAMRSADFAACPLLHPMNLADQGSNDASVLFEAVRAWFATLPASAPVAIILDDLHWMDSSSIALLQYLLRNPKPPFRLMLAGVRSAAAPRNDSLDALLTVARREGWMETWDVGPLSAEDTAQLLGLLGSARDPGEVYAKSAGHPLAALALALEDGHKDGKAAGGARVSLDAMLDERIRMAGEAGRSVLQWAALLGRGLSPALLETLTDLGVHPMLGALESLEHSGLVKIASGKAGLEYLFGHDLIRERVQSSLSAARRERMHAHVAQTLRRNFSLSRGWEEIAHHAELGAIWDLAAEACLEAGLHCFRLRAYPAALEFSMRGIDHLDRLEGRWALLGQLCALANHSGGISGNFPDGFEARLSGLMLKARAAGEEETALHLLSLITNLRFEQDRFSDLRDTALQVADAPAANVDPIIRARYFADTAICLFVTDQEIAKARSMIREAQSLCERHGFREGTTEIGQAVIASREGRYAEARKQMAEAATLLSPTDYQAVEHHMLSNSAIVELESDNPLEALSFAEKLRVPSQAMAGKADAHFPDALAALAKKMLGEPEAEALFQEVLARLRACNCKVMTAYVLLFWSEMELRDGRFDRIHAFAEEALDRCTPLGRKLEPVWAHCLMGLAALRQNDRETAQSHWDRMAAIRPPRADLTARVFQRVEELALGLGHPI